MTSFFTSDTHFCHSNIIKHCPNREFKTIEEHDNFLINSWNAVVKPNDIVFHLGDFALGHIDNVLNVLKRLNGKIILIAGNHDTYFLKNKLFKDCFYLIYKKHKEIELFSKEKEYTVVLSHYFLPQWRRNRSPETLHFYGHSHTSIYNIGNGYNKGSKDVGVDSQYDYRPWEKTQLIEHIESEKEKDLCYTYKKNMWTE